MFAGSPFAAAPLAGTIQASASSPGRASGLPVHGTPATPIIQSSQ